MNRRFCVLFTLILISIFVLRISLSYSSQTLDPESYYFLRQAESVQSTLLPISHDTLSFGGRIIESAPLPYYILALFTSWISPVLSILILSSLAVCLTLFFIFLITAQIIKNHWIALFTMLTASVIPIFFVETLYSFSSHTLMVPLILAATYFFIQSRHSKQFAHIYLIILIILPFISPSALIFIFSLVIYAITMIIEGRAIRKHEQELIWFSLFLVPWVLFILFKKSLLTSGPRALWGNAPIQYLTLDYSVLNMLGIIPLFLGIYSMYHYSRGNRNDTVSLLLALFGSYTFMTYIGILAPSNGMIYIGLLLSLFTGITYATLLEFLKETKVAALRQIIIIVALGIIIGTLTVSSFQSASNTSSRLSSSLATALDSLSETTSPKDVILSIPKHGHFITYSTQSKNVADTNYLLLKSPERQLEDIKNIYTATNPLLAQRILDKYSIDYILVTNESTQKYGPWQINDSCFEEMRFHDVAIFKVECRLGDK